jgi:hypothetical protein
MTGSWSASLFGAEVAKIEAASWGGSINLYFNVNYGGPKTCQAIYNNPCFVLDATCDEDEPPTNDPDLVPNDV